MSTARKETRERERKKERGRKKNRHQKNLDLTVCLGNLYGLIIVHFAANRRNSEDGRKKKNTGTKRERKMEHK